VVQADGQGAGRRVGQEVGVVGVEGSEEGPGVVGACQRLP